MKTAFIIKDRESMGVLSTIGFAASHLNPVFVFGPRIHGREQMEFGFPLFLFHPYREFVQKQQTLKESAQHCLNMLKDINPGSVYLYGAGLHTQKLLKLWQQEDCIPIKGILVTEKPVQDTFMSLPVYGLSGVELNSNHDVVVFSSESFESEMKAALERRFAEVQCIGLYHFENTSLNEPARTTYLSYFQNHDCPRKSAVQNWASALQPEMIYYQKGEDPELLKALRSRFALREFSCNDKLKIPYCQDTVKLSGSQKVERKFVYIDQSLMNSIGHYYQYAKHVIEALPEDWTSHLVCNQLLEKACDHANHVWPIFRFDIWGKDPLTGAVPPVSTSADDFANKFVSVVKTLDLTADDHVFIPNLSDPELLALSQAIGNVRDRNFGLSLFLRYPLKAGINRIALLESILQDFPNVKFFTDTEELREAHSSNGKVRLEVLPIPVVSYADQIEITQPQEASLNVAYLGDGRAEKGFHLLPELIEGFYRDNPGSPHRFEIQNYSKGWDELANHTVEQLKTIAKRYPVTLHNDPLSQADYDDLVKRADILLCLYDKNVYRDRSSHIFTEAVCYGKEVMVTRGSSPGNQLDPGCPWVVEPREHALASLNCMVRERKRSRYCSSQYQSQFLMQSTGSALIAVLLK